MSIAIKVSVVGINQQTMAEDVIIPTEGLKVYTETNADFPTAVSKIVVPRPPNSANYDNYWVTETIDELLTEINADAVVNLDVVDDLTVGDDIHFVKELDHDIDVNTSTTAATAGGAINIKGGIGATSGAGGAVTITGGTAGATAASVGGAVTITSGVSGAGNGLSGALSLKSGASTAANTGTVTLASGVPATSGNSGTVTIASGAATTGDSGAMSYKSGTAVTGNSGTVAVGSGAVTTGNSAAVTISTGNAGTGDSGDIVLSPGTASAVVGKIKASNAIVMNHKTAAVNTTATATAKQTATGYFTSTSAAAVGLTLPTATDLASELGAVQGTVFDFYVDNTAGANTVTVIVNTGIVAQSVLTGGETLTIAASATEGIGCFRIMFSSATTAVLARLS